MIPVTAAAPNPTSRPRYWETTITLRGIVEAPTAGDAFAALKKMVGLPAETGGYVVACSAAETFPEPEPVGRRAPLLALD